MNCEKCGDSGRTRTRVTGYRDPGTYVPDLCSCPIGSGGTFVREGETRCEATYPGPRYSAEGARCDLPAGHERSHHHEIRGSTAAVVWRD